MTNALPELNTSEVKYLLMIKIETVYQVTFRYRCRYSRGLFIIIKIFQVGKIIESFKDIYQLTLKLTSARVYKIPNQPNNIIVSEWAQCNLERLKSMKIMRHMMSDSKLKSCVDIDTIDISDW